MRTAQVEARGCEDIRAGHRHARYTVTRMFMKGIVEIDMRSVLIRCRPICRLPSSSSRGRGCERSPSMRAVLAAGALAAFAWAAGPVQARMPPAVAPYTLRFDVENAEETLASLRRLGCEDAAWE